MNADSQYDRQFLAWALDRALRFYEVNKQTCTPDEVTKLAETFCGWVMPAPDAVEPEPVKTPDEAAIEAEHAKHLEEANVVQATEQTEAPAAEVAPEVQA